MGHDWSLFVPTLPEEPLHTIMRLIDDEEEGANDPTFTEIEYQRQQRVVYELVQQHHPMLLALELPLRDLATFVGIAEDVVQTVVTGIKAQQHDMGVQILLADTMISVRVPYWYSGLEAETVLKTLWTYFRWLEDVAGYRVYDEQLGQVVDLEAGFQQVFVKYTDGTRLTQTLR